MYQDRLSAFLGLLLGALAVVTAALATPVSAATTERSVYYSYDLMGRQLTAKFDSAAGSDGVTNVYDGFGDVTSSTLTMGTFSKTLTSAYDGVGNRTQLTHPDGQAFTYSYDALGRLSGLYEGVGTATALDTFAYGNNGLVSSRSEAGGSSVSYGYDDIGRLTSQNDAFTGGSGNVARTLAFNPASGLTAETRDNDSYAFPTSQIGSVNRAYAVNGLNQYTSAGPASFTYDANGNLITDGTWTYTYDVENRLVHATGAGKDVTLIYDPLGRLFQLGGSGVGDVQFLYDGDALIADYVVSTGAMNDRFVHGSNAAADDPLVWYGGSAVGSGNRNLLHADHLGSIVARTSGGGATINSYDEYGIPATTNSGRFGYTGQAWLYEIGLDYYKARMYSPSLGRFLQTDPIGYAAGVGFYEYAVDDPINFVDYLGTAPGDPFPSAEEAANDALDYYNPTSIKQNREYIGEIQFHDGHYFATRASPGSFHETPHLTLNTKLDIGWYHTHANLRGDPSSRNLYDEFDSENFSTAPGGDTDMTYDALDELKKDCNCLRDFKAFLGTPSGRHLEFDPLTGHTTQIGRDKPASKDTKSTELFDLGGILYGNAARGSKIGCPAGEGVC